MHNSHWTDLVNTIEWGKWSETMHPCALSHEKYVICRHQKYPINLDKPINMQNDKIKNHIVAGRYYLTTPRSNIKLVAFVHRRRRIWLVWCYLLFTDVIDRWGQCSPTSYCMNKHQHVKTIVLKLNWKMLQYQRGHEIKLHVHEIDHKISRKQCFVISCTIVYRFVWSHATKWRIEELFNGTFHDNVSPTLHISKTNPHSSFCNWPTGWVKKKYTTNFQNMF